MYPTLYSPHISETSSSRYRSDSRDSNTRHNDNVQVVVLPT